ncbi:MAG: methanogen output domain 1-containing protein [Candidatus Binataceae bacterium]|jgi:predicted ArsR family transcriptional regulator
MPDHTIEESSIPLDRDIFFRSLIRELAGTLEGIVGLKEASGFVSIVGQRIGEAINQYYQDVTETSVFDRSQVAKILVDLKRRIGGDFFIVEEGEERIVFGNRRCPFGEKVIGRPSMCMMTSNVFGSIAADNLGFAKVQLRETIAQGAPGCVVVVHLQPTAEASAVEGREYVKA